MFLWVRLPCRLLLASADIPLIRGYSESYASQESRIAIARDEVPDAVVLLKLEVAMMPCAVAGGSVLVAYAAKTEPRELSLGASHAFRRLVVA